MLKKVKYKISKSLISKSIDAFLLSLELYNKPTINYRAESFSLLFTNAWELMIKAHIYELSGGKKLSIFYPKKKNQKRTSLTIDESLRKVFPEDNNPVRRNIEYISDIRNEAAHLIIVELDPYFSRVFQSGVANYVRFIFDWFEIDMNERLNPGLISLITDQNNLQNFTLLKSKYNKEDLDSVNEWVERFKNLEGLGDSATISINHTIAIVRNPKRADFILSSGPNGKRPAIVIRKEVNPDISHPFNRKNAISEIKKRIPSEIKFTEYDFEARAFVTKCKRENNDYFYRGRYSGAGQYSQKYIDEFVEAINKDSKNLKRWRKQYGQYLKTKK